MTFLFIHRCWQGTTLVERTFHLDNLIDRFAVHSSDCLWIQFFKYFFKVYVQFSPCPFPPESLAWRLRKEALWGVVTYTCPCQNFFTIVFGIPVSIPSSCRLSPFHLSVLCRCSRVVLLVEMLPQQGHVQERPTCCIDLHWMNDFPVIRDPCFAHRILGSPGGKHCESLQRNVWRGVVSSVKAVSLDRECSILLWFYEKRRWLMLERWNFKFLCD